MFCNSLTFDTQWILLYITKPSHPVCVSLTGTPVSDTVCERCPAGHFSAGGSSTEACQRHRNCSDSGLKTLRWGTSTTDSLCGTQDKAAAAECSPHHTLCHTGENRRRTVQDTNTVGPIWKVSEWNSFVQHIHNTHPCDNVFV